MKASPSRAIGWRWLLALWFGLLWVGFGVLAPPAAARQGSKKPAAKEEKPPKIKVPPGDPTTRENIYLPTPQEIKLGRQVSYQVEKQFKVLTSGPEYERVQRIAGPLIKAVSQPDIIRGYMRAYRPLKKLKKKDKSTRRPFEWQFKVIEDDKVVNAFSLAGGPVYITTGLIKQAGSDDEIAAVLAHEVTHTAYHHVMRMVAKQRKASKNMLWALLAAVLIGAGGGGLAGATPALLGGQLVNAAVLSGYSRELETEADRVGIRILLDTDYNPVAMLTFMRKLARQDKLRGNPDAGVYQSHPYSNVRLEAIQRELARDNIRVDAGVERQASGVFQVAYRDATAGGRPAGDVMLNGRLLFRCIAEEGRFSARQRARAMTATLRTAFRNSVTFDDVKLTPDRTGVTIRGQVLVRPLPADVAGNGASARALAKQAYDVIMRALWQEKLQKSF